jgi:hypothetical protein
MSNFLTDSTLGPIEDEIAIRRATNSQFYEIYTDHPGMGLIALKMEVDEFLRAGQRQPQSPEQCLVLIRKFASFLLTYLEIQGCPPPEEAELSNIRAAQRMEITEANFERLREELPDLKDNAYEVRTEEREDDGEPV